MEMKEFAILMVVLTLALPSAKFRLFRKRRGARSIGGP